MIRTENRNRSAGDAQASPTPNRLNPSPLSKSGGDKKSAQNPVSTLIICRNKHWRYISSFHGPWLQLPPEVLESLANNNFNLPRPRPIDPATFFDLLKIRKLVDDATSLAVRATSGVTLSSLTNSLNAGNGLLGNGGTALGLGLGGGGGNAKLSRERKHRMREQATQKLSKAYHLDEIACSVATMQSASTLEDVAQLVMQRNRSDADAKYVHFFHEKIPSRQLAECTSLKPLDEVIAERPEEAEILRTRAVTKIFKNDLSGAAQDLTLALKVHKYYKGQHKARKQQLQVKSEAAAEAQRSGRWKEEARLVEEDHPNSLESQLLFHRAGVYLTIACEHVDAALSLEHARCGIDGSRLTSVASRDNLIDGDSAINENEKLAQQRCLEARKIVKTNSKMALRDYLTFLSFLDYTPGLPAETAQNFIRKDNLAAQESRSPSHQDYGNGLDKDRKTSLRNCQVSIALVPHNEASISGLQQHPATPRTENLSRLPSSVVYRMSVLFSATPPANLPPYPEASTSLITTQQMQTPQGAAAKALVAKRQSQEVLTYHPLLTDALHSLLLCHCLIQTSTRELQRHAYMVARLARICDGYPIFQVARSPSRADWIEVLRRAADWIQLRQPWDSLCAPTPLPGQSPQGEQMETPAERKERLKQEAILAALEDDRVNDETSFHTAVAARQRRQEEEARKAEGREVPRRWAQGDGKEYPLSTDRAHAIVRWIREASVGREAGGARRKKKRSTKVERKDSVRRSNENSMSGLKVDGRGNGEQISTGNDRIS